jgi:hypothetical protein
VQVQQGQGPLGQTLVIGFLKFKLS